MSEFLAAKDTPKGGEQLRGALLRRWPACACAELVASGELVNAFILR